MKEYTYTDLKKAYANLGVTKGKTVIVKTDLRLLGFYKPCLEAKSALEAHYFALKDLIDFDHGTLITTTATTNLCNSSLLFDLNTTPSQMGVLTEYIRNQPHAVRSFHPFLSYTAIGKHAEEICCNVSRHGFGLETPKARMLEFDPLFISIGLHARLTASVVHHAEMLMGVPYRYTKEFIHPVVRNNNVVKELFYMHVWYRACQNKHDGLRKIFESYIAAGNTLNSVAVGRGFIYSMPLVPYFKSTIKTLRENIYAFLVEPPLNKPYQI